MCQDRLCTIPYTRDKARMRSFWRHRAGFILAMYSASRMSWCDLFHACAKDLNRLFILSISLVQLILSFRCSVMAELPFPFFCSGSDFEIFRGTCCLILSEKR